MPMGMSELHVVQDSFHPKISLWAIAAVTAIDGVLVRVGEQLYFLTTALSVDPR